MEWDPEDDEDLERFEPIPTLPPFGSRVSA